MPSSVEERERDIVFEVQPVAGTIGVMRKVEESWCDISTMVRKLK